jgi:hypothetical protein
MRRERSQRSQDEKSSAAQRPRHLRHQAADASARRRRMRLIEPNEVRTPGSGRTVRERLKHSTSANPSSASAQL